MALMIKDSIFKAVCLIGLAIMISFSVSYATVTDIECLKKFKESVEDPLNYLDSWNFDNNTEGYICKFTGIDCWHPDENRVLNLRLSEMELKGKFPHVLINCSSITGLDLSNNKFYGSLPDNISSIIGFVTSLDLSSNRFSGPIPKSLANCSFLNSLKLNNNMFNGSIPLELGGLSRMKEFSVANNLLVGTVPSFQASSITADDYANNPGLCGKLLKECDGVRKKPIRVGVIVGAAIGGVTFASIVIVLVFCYFVRFVARKKEDDPEGNKWAKSIKGTKGIKVGLINSIYCLEQTLFSAAVKDFVCCSLLFSYGL